MSDDTTAHNIILGDMYDEMYAQQKPKKTRIRDLSKALFLAVKAHVTATKPRITFYASLVLLIILFIIAQFDPTGTAAWLAFVVAIVCLVASAIDTRQTQAAFNKMIDDMHESHTNAILAIDPDALKTAQTKQLFAQADIDYINRKNKTFKYSFIAKVVIVVILVIFLAFNMM